MSNCASCGSSIPEEQNICSMCYGDIAFGTDGYYEEWARQREQYEREQEEREQYEREQEED